MFFWIFAVIALVLAFAPPRYRKIGFAVVGAVFLVFLTIVLVNRRPLPDATPAAAPAPSPAAPTSRRFDFEAYQQEKRDQADPEAKTRIAAAEIRFAQLQPIAGLEPGTLQAVHARLYNDSRRFTLTNYWYYLVVQDCLPAAKKSAAPAKASVSVSSTAAPAANTKPSTKATASMNANVSPNTNATPSTNSNTHASPSADANASPNTNASATPSADANTNANDSTADRCTTVYDQRDSASLTVPPGQARDIALSIPNNATGSATPFKLLGTPRIELEVTDTRAYQ